MCQLTLAEKKQITHLKLIFKVLKINKKNLNDWEYTNSLIKLADFLLESKLLQQALTNEITNEVL